MNSTRQMELTCWSHFLHVGLLLLGLVCGSASEDRNTSCSSPMDSSDVLKNLLNVSSARVRPDVDGPPVAVHCGFHIVNFGPFNDVDMEQ
ncbi:hypothetical protein NP493_571g00028 [Ridgeia piscesae]|uniref:Secreted protein n=1 Tax=Ridgeia piscesae TaxID=27915 RepID=A0AAD9KUX4_RIDPI|nr:hypothetical protein NP493_571g00028 [Ridgeia piscesae]